MDDVLVHIATPWVRKALKRPNIQNAIGHLLKDDDTLQERVLNRKEPYIQEWLVNEFHLPRKLVDEVNLVYRADPTFYDDLLPTPICLGFINALSLPGRVSALHVITLNFNNDDPCVESKNRWLDRIFTGNSRVHIHNLNAGEKKSDCLKQHCPEPTIFVDDTLKNVVDILLCDDVKPEEILIPKMGHNPAHIVDGLAHIRKINLTYYENVV